MVQLELTVGVDMVVDEEVVHVVSVVKIEIEIVEVVDVVRSALT